MATALTVGFLVLVGLGIVSYAGSSIKRSGQRAAGQRRCASCGTRLRRAANRHDGYATTCSRCGTTQPWSPQAQAQAAADRAFRAQHHQRMAQIAADAAERQQRRERLVAEARARQPLLRRPAPASPVDPFAGS